MGLGKTVIAIEAAERLFASGDVQTCVIMCPPSLKYQWAQRIAQFTDLPSHTMKLKDEEITVPSQNCVIVSGSKTERYAQYHEIYDHRPRYVLIGYDSIINDYQQIAKIQEEMVVLDEATAIKTFKAQRTKKIKKCLKPKWRLALTGTPVENRPDEIYSIMQWVDDGILGRYDLFDKAYITRNNHGWVVAYKNLHVLKNKLASAISRKSREDPDVKPYLPDVDTTTWTVPMEPQVLEVYKIIASDMLAELDNAQVYSDFSLDDYYSGNHDNRPSGKLMGMYMCLEMLLDHPDLIIWSGNKYMDDSPEGSRYAYHLWQSDLIDELTVSPKLTLMLEKLDIILADPQSKVLIFSKWRFMLDLIERDLTCKSVKFHGGMNPSSKAAAVAHFTNTPDCRVFLSSHAGAYGMDMYMADYLINYDHPWSAGTADQINNRHVRTSSEFDKVYVVNMVTEGSMEERKLRILDMKRRLGSAILDGHGATEQGVIEIDGDSLKNHLQQVLTAASGAGKIVGGR
jgi:SNF2 family DNA or RNA helicase